MIQGTVTGIAAALGVFKGADGEKCREAVRYIVRYGECMAGGGSRSGHWRNCGISTAITAAEKAAARANLDRHFGDITLSVEELDDAARHIVSGGGNLFEQLDNFHSASDDAKQLLHPYRAVWQKLKIRLEAVNGI